ncbi:MAG: hypothetical protein WC725_01725 [Patescibacteria group bacterium]|jgi:hypothetical protein
MVDLKKEQNPIINKEKYQSLEADFSAGEKGENISEKIEKESEVKTDTEIQHKQPLHHRPVSHVLPPLRDPVAQKIEKILEENVGEAYSRLSPIAKEEFKIKGEITAKKIAELLSSTHVKVKKVFQLIMEWLKMLPGINRFFLEQEAKIKTDRILALHKRK